MVYPEILHGKFVDLRSISLEDAEFSYNIRADRQNRETVGQLAESIEAQRNYIKKQMEEPNDYYFVVLNKMGKRIGLFGVYDVNGDMAEIGREVNIGEPTERMEVPLLIGDFCRNVLKLRKVCFVVYSNNVNHIADVKKTSKFVKFIKRSGRDALYFESDLYEDNEMNKKIRKIIDRLYDKGF